MPRPDVSCARNGTRARILALFGAVATVSSDSVAYALDISQKLACVHLGQLRAKGQIRRTSQCRYPARYELVAR